MLRHLLACNWILMLTVLGLADRGSGGESGALDPMSLLKVASRLGTLGIVGYVLWTSRENPRLRFILSMLFPWCLYTAWAVASFGWSALPSVSLGQASSLMILLMLSCGVALEVHRMADVSAVLKHLCVAMLLISAVVLAAKYGAPDTYSLSRAGKGVFHATNAAATAGLGIVVITACRILFGWRWTRWLLMPSLFVHGATLILASNRASLAITALVAVMIILLGVSSLMRWLLITAACLVFAAYIAADPALQLATGLGDRLGEYMARDQSKQELAALSGREEMWAVMWNSFLRSPWLGHGYFVSSESGKLKVWYLWSNWTAHNFWLQVLVSTGIIGALFLAWAKLSYVARLVQARHLPGGSQCVVLLGVMVLFWQCGWGLTNESFVGPLQAESIAFFTVFGLVVGRLSRAEAAASLRSPGVLLDRRYTFAPALAGKLS